MKRVSFEVAKVIKEAGYPQIFIDCAYYEDNKLHHIEDPYNTCRTIIAYAPTYLEVWLWLWREKGIQFEQGANVIYDSNNNLIKVFKNTKTIDPEEAIIGAIEYLVKNNLIK